MDVSGIHNERNSGNLKLVLQSSQPGERVMKNLVMTRADTNMKAKMIVVKLVALSSHPMEGGLAVVDILNTLLACTYIFKPRTLQ